MPPVSLYAPVGVDLFNSTGVENACRGCLVSPIMGGLINTGDEPISQQYPLQTELLPPGQV